MNGELCSAYVYIHMYRTELHVCLYVSLGCVYSVRILTGVDHAMFGESGGREERARERQRKREREGEIEREREREKERERYMYVDQQRVCECV